jgi:signal transduction histidine kinase
MVDVAAAPWSLTPDPSAPGDQGSGVRDQGNEDRVNILLVDDQPENLVALEAMLEPLGQRLIRASSGREALRVLLDTEVAVILLDVRMPEMDGFETATLIRARERTRDTPIIFLTAGDQSLAQVFRGYQVGAVDYMVKPVVPEVVKSKVAVFVELAKKTAMLVRQAEALRRREQEARELAELRAELVADLEEKNRELERFTYAVSHDLRAPLRRIDGFGRALLETQEGRLDDTGVRWLERIRTSTAQAAELIEALLYLSRVTRGEIRRLPVSLSALAEDVAAQLRASEPERPVEFVVRANVDAEGDPRLLRLVLENLLANAWKFTAGRDPARIEFGLQRGGLAGGAGEEAVYFVRDNGAGFDMAYADRLFSPFHRLHSPEEFPGTGIGLATVHRIVHRHGGRVWGEAAVDEGATFRFTLGRGGGSLEGAG